MPPSWKGCWWSEGEGEGGYGREEELKLGLCAWLGAGPEVARRRA